MIVTRVLPIASLLPRHRGPVPVAWTIRNGEDETGTTIHRMDADLDTGAILAQRTMSMGEYTEPEEFYGRLGPLHIDACSRRRSRRSPAHGASSAQTPLWLLKTEPVSEAGATGASAPARATH